MPGLSFLFKKRFHPARYDNQKKLFIAEQSTTALAEREKEAAEESRKEKEIVEYEELLKKMPLFGDGDNSKGWALR